MSVDAVLHTSQNLTLSEIANTTTMKLHDSALFKFARELWLVMYNKDSTLLNNCWRDRISDVTDYFLEHYSETPAVIQRQIINVIRIIGKEICELVSYCRKVPYSNYYRHIFNLRIDQIYWTSQFTIDRVKTSLICADNDSIDGYECPKWVKKKWDSQTVDTKFIVNEFFGKYSIIAYIYWEIYAGYHLIDFEKYLILYGSYFDSGAYEERIFRFFILNGNLECLDYFKVKITPERHREIVSKMTEAIITRTFPSQLRSSQHILVQTAVFLWNYLDQEDRCRIVQKHFSKFYQFLLCFPGTESLISAIEWYKPILENTRENCRYLENTAIKITTDFCEGQRYRCMFQNLYKSVGISLSTIDVVNLLEVILAIKDIETASMMVRMMDEDKRNELLNVIPEVWNDLWKGTIERETFLAFFFEVQSHIFRSSIRNNV